MPSLPAPRSSACVSRCSDTPVSMLMLMLALTCAACWRAWPQVYGRSEELVHSSLMLFQDLASGYMSGKLLMKLDAVAFLLQHHSSAHYSFLDHPANGRSRTTFYTTLARLLFMEDTPAKFRAFVAPLQQVLVNLAEAIRMAPSPAALRASVPPATVTGLFRDLRGIATATATRR